MAKPIEDSANSAAFREALDVPTNAELAAKYTKPVGGIPAEDLNADPAGRILLTATSAAERKAAIGLDQVNNTSDANKPVSTAQALAIAEKMDKTLPALQAVYDGGTAPQKAAFQASVSGGRLVLAASGSVAAPVATISAAAAGSFVLPSKSIPPGFMIPGKSSISGTVIVRRVGAAGTAAFSVTIGPSDSTSDAILYSSTLAATTNNDLRAQPEGFAAEATRISTPVWLTPGSSGASAVLDRTSGFNTQVQQFIGVRIASANAADMFHLIAYRFVIDTAA